jgi:hypothetical protein
VQVLLRHDLFADPDRELTPATLDQVGVDPGLLLDERRRTGSAWTIVSDLAESNADVFHDMTPRFPRGRLRTCQYTQQDAAAPA